MSNAGEKVYLTIPRNNAGEYIRVTRIKGSGGRLDAVDLRIMYTGNDGELKFTPRGVRMNSEITPEIIAAMVESLEIEELTELGSKLSSETLKNLMAGGTEEDDGEDDYNALEG